MTIQIRPLEPISDNGVYHLLMYRHLHKLGVLHSNMLDYMTARPEEFSVAARQVIRTTYNTICKQAAEVIILATDDLAERWKAMDDYAHVQVCEETERSCRQNIQAAISAEHLPPRSVAAIQNIHNHVFHEIMEASKAVRVPL